MAIIPDTKDWTWVVTQRCEDCGFDPAGVVSSAVGERVRRNAATWLDVLAHDDVDVRPDESTWSPLEYACHVRDVLALFRSRLGLMLDEDDPVFPNWDQDVTAVESAYAAQDPQVVAGELIGEAALTADAFDVVAGVQWSRTGRRTDGASFTVTTFASYFLHDIEHHAHDVGAG